MKIEERVIIHNFFNYFNKKFNKNFLFLESPEESKNTPSNQMIDAIYSDGQDRIAIELTSVEGYEGQRRFEHHLGMFDSLRNIRAQLPSGGYYALIISKYFSVPGRKQERENILNDLSRQMVNVAPILKLPDVGRINVNAVQAGGMKFILERGNLNGKLEDKLLVKSFSYDRDEKRSQVETAFRKAITDSNGKLSAYAARGMKTLVLLECIEWGLFGELYDIFTSKIVLEQNPLPQDIFLLQKFSTIPWHCALLKSDAHVPLWDEFKFPDEIE